ncbi:MAG: histidinol dehydrogenase, partial [Rhodobacteraceae bacterium]|nr:histidinol dehydrogenase [Paracoccaceae bacterium]
MPYTYLKKAPRTAETGQTDVRAAVEAMLAEIARDGDAAARRFAHDLDHWDGDIVVSLAEIRAASDRLPEALKADIRFAHANIRR